MRGDNPPFGLPITLDSDDGQLLGIEDPALEMPVFSAGRGPELLLNGQPLALRKTEVLTRPHEHMTRFEAERHPTYKTGQRLAVNRIIVRGGGGLHTAPCDSLHIRYEIERKPWGEWSQPMDQIWGAPLESPLQVETVSALAAPMAWFGPRTRMRTIAIGGSGPREHVSYEDGPVAEVVERLGCRFRTAFPGQQTVPGALYYDPEDERFCWILVRQPHVGGHLDFRAEGQIATFAWFKDLAVGQRLVVPEISLFWGRGLDRAEQVLAQQFDRFREPPPWWFHTTWFWLHPMWQRDADFDRMAEAIDVLMDECGVTGFGLGIHDIPWSGRDVDYRSPRPCSSMGGEDRLRRACDRIRDRGGHVFAWTSRTAHYPAGDYRERWAVRGADGRPVQLDPMDGSGVRMNIINALDRDWRAYIEDWVRSYVQDLGINGLFWDSGAQPMPPDFAPRPEIDCPGEAMVAPVRFYEEIYRFGKRLDPDFFMWLEGATTEITTNAMAVDSANHHGASGHRLMARLAHLGPRRLVWRSAWAQDFQPSRFLKPRWSPSQTELHIAGDEAFGDKFTRTEGLGPVYNAASCDSCHPGEAKGHPTFNLTRFGAQRDETFSPLVELGGPQLQDRAVDGYPAESIPSEATGVATLSPPAITGLGYVEAVDDATLFEMADPEDEDGDGISGRVQLVDASGVVADVAEVSRLTGETDPDRLTLHDGQYVGRFGWKASAINLRHQTITAYGEDMGITSPSRPVDLGNPRAVGEASEDAVEDPEVPRSTVSNVVFYLKTLRAPRRRQPGTPDVRAGEKIFSEIGCADCHHPEMTTGDSTIDQLSNATFHPYSDFLLHDMGPELDDGYTEGRAETSEWRTPPLWGLGLADDFQGGTPHLMHDGRATSISEAIALHGGEAADARDAFDALDDREQSQLVAFLESL